MGPRGKFPLMSEINMVPLIDVSLVLLIIFMVVTPFMVATEIKVNLPKANTGAPGEMEPLKIMVSERGGYYIEGQSFSLKDLESQIKIILSKRPGAPVLIEADQTTDFERVVKVMDRARQAGAERLGVAVIPENENPK